MSKVIISLIGYGGSGKTTTSQRLQKEYGFYVFTFSNALRSYADKHRIQLNTRADYARVHARIIDKYGVGYLPSLALSTGADLVCVDNLSSVVYADYFRKLGGKEIVFDCPVEVRFSRTRDSSDSAKYPSTLETFIQNERDDEAVEIGQGVRIEPTKLIGGADYHVDASLPLPAVLERVDNIIDQILSS